MFETGEGGAAAVVAPPHAASSPVGAFRDERRDAFEAALAHELVDAITELGHLMARFEGTQVLLITRLAELRFQQQEREQQHLLEVLALDGKTLPPQAIVDRGESDRFTGDEVAAALCLPPMTGAAKVDLARTLVERVPATQRALAEGRIDMARARAIADAVTVLAPADAARVEQACLADAHRRTAGQVARTARRLVVAADPAAADRRHRAALKERSAFVRPLDDGMAQMCVTGRADRVSLAWQGATALAAHLVERQREAGDQASGGERPTLEQARSDAILALLATPGALDAVAGGVTAGGAGGSAAAGGESPGATGPDHDTRDGSDASHHEGTDAPAGTAQQSAAHAGPDPARSTAADAGPETGHGPFVDADLHVRVVVPMDALADGSDSGGTTSAGAATPPSAPAELVGYGPIAPAMLADLLARAADPPGRWDPPPIPKESGSSSTGGAGTGAAVALTRWFTDASGVVAATADREYPGHRPPPLLGRLVRARDRTCRFPGCARAAERCDLDHTVPHPEGPTAARNLAALCRRHHRLKTHTRWRVRHLEGAVLEWVTPTGRTYRTEPPDLGPVRALAPATRPRRDEDLPPPF